MLGPSSKLGPNLIPGLKAWVHGYKVVNRIVNERASVTPEIAIKLAAAFETTPDFWLNAQMATDLWMLRSQKGKIPPLIRARRRISREFSVEFICESRAFQRRERLPSWLRPKSDAHGAYG